MSNHVDRGKQPMHPDRGKQPMHPGEFPWMSHWSALEEQNLLSTLLGSHGTDHGTNQWHLQKGKEITSDITGSVKQHTKMSAIDFGILKSDRVKRSRNRKKNRPEPLDPSIVNLYQKSQHTPNIEHAPSLLSLAPPGTESSYMDHHIQHISVSQWPGELVNAQQILGSSLGFSAPFPDNFNGKTSCVSPGIIDRGEGICESGSIPTAPSFLYRVEKNDNHVKSIPSSKRKLSGTNITEVMEPTKCIDGSRVLYGNLSMTHSHPPALHKEQNKIMNNSSSTNLFSPYAHEANTMRIYTSAENLGGFTPIYQANNTFLVMETTDTNLWKEDRNFRDSRGLTHVNENVPIKCYSFPQLIGHGYQGLQIQVLSSDSEGKDDVHDVSAAEVVSKNTSTETHTMDMNMVKEKHASGVESFSSKKNVTANTGLPHLDLAIGTSGEKVQPHKRPIPAIPDMNIQLHAEPGEASEVDNAEPSTSRTRSLDLDYVPDSRWLKRLKISDPCDLSVGTKSLRLDEATTREKPNQFVSRCIRGESSNSEPVPVPGKELMVVNQKTNPPRAAVSSSNDTVDGSDGTKGLHSWIQRWRKSPAANPKTKSEPVVISDPQCSRVSLEKLQKKPISSIAVLALLGKGWSGLKCQYRSEGSVTVWES